jgi:hypothetical protein
VSGSAWGLACLTGVERSAGPQGWRGSAWQAIGGPQGRRGAIGGPQGLRGAIGGPHCEGGRGHGRGRGAQGEGEGEVRTKALL